MIRPAQPGDEVAIHEMICELAEYEEAAHEVLATTADLARTLFAEHPLCHALIAQDANQPVGFALWFVTFSTWQGRHGIYLEDLYVRPQHRGSGHGRALIAELATIATTRGYGRLEWSVLDWNESAIEFYRTLGAQGLPQWHRFRLSGDTLNAAARTISD